jgi:hypothetical protein
MADIVTSQNIHLSSCDILYNRGHTGVIVTDLTCYFENTVSLVFLESRACQLEFTPGLRISETNVVKFIE